MTNDSREDVCDDRPVFTPPQTKQIRHISLVRSHCVMPKTKVGFNIELHPNSICWNIKSMVCNMRRNFVEGVNQ